MEPKRSVDEKGRIRAELLKVRNGIPPSVRRRLGERIINALQRLNEFRTARHVMSYVAIKGEVQTEELIRECIRSGKTVSIPCCDPASGLISAAVVRDFDRDLSPGCYGIPEPAREQRNTVDGNEIDLVIVPGVGFDWTGVRLGWGKGCYDRFLTQANRAVKIGLAYEAQVLPLIKPGDHDVAVDKIVTEERVIDCSKLRGKL